MNVTPSFRRFGYFGIGPVLVGCLLAFALVDMLWAPLGKLHQKYPDPVVGAIGIGATDKSRDDYALMILLAGTVGMTLGITALGRMISPPNDDQAFAGNVNQLLLFSLIPATYRLTIACLSPVNQVPPLRFLSLFPIGALATLVMLGRYRDHLRPSDVFEVCGAAILTPVMAAFSSLGVMLAISRLAPAAIHRIQPWGPTVAIAVLAAAVATVLVVFALSPTIELCRARMLRCLMVSQYPCVLLLFLLVPPPLVDTTRLFRNPYPIALVVTLSVIALGCALAMAWRFGSVNIKANRPLIRAVAPASVMAITLFLLCPNASVPTISNDFFHSGEQLLPWQQIWDFHAVPYVDFSPVHGLMEVGCGALNQLFFDGSVANVSCAYALLCGLSIAMISFTASACLTPLGAMIFLLAVLPGDRFLFAAPCLFVIAAPRVLANPVRWLVVYLTAGVLSCGYNAALGPAFVLGTLPVAVWQAWRAFRLQRPGLGALICVLVAIAAAVLSVAMVRTIAVGYIHFILDNAWTNEPANGVNWSLGAWKRDRFTGLGSSQLLWEIARFAWIPALISCLVINWKQWSKPSAMRDISTIVLSISIPLFALWSCVWTIERIGPGELSRPGWMTQLVVFFLIPAMLLVALPKKYTALAMMAIACLMGVFAPGIPAGIDPVSVIDRPFSIRFIPGGTGMLDGPSLGMPRIGQVIKPDAAFIRFMSTFKKHITGLLQPGETYFDLTNQTAFYFYLDLRCPSLYAPYVAANARMQGDMMRQVDARHVPVVLISPAMEIDGLRPSLRCYRPYHDFVLKYPVYRKDGFTFLVEPSRNSQFQTVGSEPQLQVLDAIFRPENLLRIPIAWGDSFASMRSRFDTVSDAGQVLANTLTLAGSDTWEKHLWRSAIPAAMNTGAAADYLLVHCNFAPTDPGAYRLSRRAEYPLGDNEPRLSLTWTNQDGTTSTPVQFLGQNGDLLIPLGTYPRWLLGSGFGAIDISINNPPCARKISITSLQFLRLKPL